MVRVHHGKDRSSRAGAAVVELAVVLPLLAFLFVVAVDYSRLFYYSMTVQTCARNGALYGCDPTAASTLTPYASISAAALADAGNLNPQPTITSNVVTGLTESYIEVTASYPFTTITQYPGIPTTTTITRTVRMRLVSNVPSNFP